MDPTADVSISAVQDGQMPNRRSDVDLLINYPVLVDRSSARRGPDDVDLGSSTDIRRRDHCAGPIVGVTASPS